MNFLIWVLQHEFGAVVQYGHHAGVIAAFGLDSDG